MIPLSDERLFMYIGYIDDSGSSGKNLDDRQAPFQVIGGPLMNDIAYGGIELVLNREISRLVPEGQWDEFEFHASDLFHANPPFRDLGQERCFQLIEAELKWLNKFRIPIIYGATDKERLRQQLYRTCDPADIAFQLYLDCLRRWFEKQFFSQKHTPTGLLICDDVRAHKADDSRKEESDRKGDVRHVIERAFRRNRTKLRGLSGASGINLYLFDDMYFGSSKNSVGLQLADVCVYFIARHLAGKPDSEGFYDIIKDQIAFSEVYPTDASILGELEKGGVR